jgi:hypothetical protein
MVAYNISSFKKETRGTTLEELSTNHGQRNQVGGTV